MDINLCRDNSLISFIAITRVSFFQVVDIQLTRRQNELLHVTDEATTTGNLTATAAGSNFSRSFISSYRRRSLPSSDLKLAFNSPGWGVHEIRFMILWSKMVPSPQSTKFCSQVLDLYDSLMDRLSGSVNSDFICCYA